MVMGTSPQAISATTTNTTIEEEKKNKFLPLLLSCAMLALGNCGGPLLTRLYFLRGGSRIWLSSFLVTAGWPLILLPLSLTYVRRRRRRPIEPSDTTNDINHFSMKLPLFSASASIGILTGLDDYLYASGVARLPVSTSALILATHLAFTAGFAFLLVRQRFTPYSVNAIVLLTIGAVVLGLHANKDQPSGEAEGEYYLGFFMTIAGSALYGFVLPAVELTYKKAKQEMSLRAVMETQTVISLFATAFCAVGMIINHDLKAIPREAGEYELGVTMYYVVLACNAVVWQFFFIGAVGVIFCASSLFSAIVIASLVPVTGILAVIFYHEKFQAEKGVALALSLWGFASYFYGEVQLAKEKDQTPQMEMTRTPEA